MNVKTNKKCVCVGETECIKNVHGKILQNYIYIHKSRTVQALHMFKFTAGWSSSSNTTLFGSSDARTAVVVTTSKGLVS